MPPDRIAPTLARLPVELRALICDKVLELDAQLEDQRANAADLDDAHDALNHSSARANLRNLMLVSRDFCALTQPLFWRALDFEGRSNDSARWCLFHVLPRHACHVRELWLRVCDLENDVYDDVAYSDSNKRVLLSQDDAERTFGQRATRLRLDGFEHASEQERLYERLAQREADQVRAELARLRQGADEQDVRLIEDRFDEMRDAAGWSTPSRIAAARRQERENEGMRHNILLAIVDALPSLECVDVDYFPLSRHDRLARHFGSPREIVDALADRHAATLSDISVHVPQDMPTGACEPVANLIGRVPKLLRLELNGFGPAARAALRKPFERLSALETLELDDCAFVDLAVARDWAMAFPLRTLALDSCDNVSPHALLKLVDRFHETLEVLDLDACPNLDTTDPTPDERAPAERERLTPCPNLRALVIASLDPRALPMLEDQPAIEHLDIGRVPELTAPMLAAFVMRHPSISRVVNANGNRSRGIRGPWTTDADVPIAHWHDYCDRHKLDIVDRWPDDDDSDDDDSDEDEWGIDQDDDDDNDLMIDPDDLMVDGDDGGWYDDDDDESVFSDAHD